MKRFKIEIECPVCKQKFNTDIAGSQYISDCYLDGKPITKNQLVSSSHVCPNCGQLFFEIYENLIVAETEEEAYQKGIESTKEINLKYFMLRDYIWLLEYNNQNDKALELRKQLLDIIDELIVEKTNEIATEDWLNLVLVYLDNCRQTQQYDKATEIIDTLDHDWVGDRITKYNYLYKVYSYIKELINKQDSTPHLQSELKQ